MGVHVIVGTDWDMRKADLMKSAHMVANTPQSTPVVIIKNDMVGISEVTLARG